MNLAQKALTEAFPEFEVHIVTRPDGGLLLTLRNEEQDVLRRALSKGQAQAPMQLDWAISSIRRDLSLDAGVAPVITHLQSQSRSALPSYEYA